MKESINKDINIDKLKEVVNYLLDNNEDLQKKGFNKITIGIEGESGIGKTSVIQQIAESRDMKLVKINLAQIDEIGDLVGFPIKEYMIQDDNGDSKWVSEKMIDYFMKAGYKICDNCDSRMSYSIPKWVPDGSDNTIVMFDDFNRADPRFINAIMEIINLGEYISWKLPSNCQLILTSNPDNGEYNITAGLDNAQRTRFINFNLGFDARVWAKWAEEQGIPSTFINFVLLTPELYKKNNNNNCTINARSLVLFFNAISGIKDFDNNIGLINLIAEGVFPTETNVVGSLFTLFITNKLDKIPSPKDIIDGEWSTIKNKLTKLIYQKDNYRSDISCTVTFRLINYIDLYIKQQKGNMGKVLDRLELLILDCDENPILSEDLILTLIMKLNTRFPGRLSKLTMHPKIKSKLIL
jgi:hypothetical protein